MKSPIKILALLLFTSLIARAQAPKFLSLENALRLAKEKRSTLKNFELDRQIAAQNSRATRGLYLPQVSASAEVRFNTIRPTTILPGEVTGHPGTSLAIQTGTNWQNSAGVTVNQKLYDAVALSQRKSDAVNEKLAGNNLAQARRDLAIQVRQAYYQALLYQARLAFLKTDHDSKARTLSDIKLRQAEGRTLATEVTEAEIALRNVSLNLELGESNFVTGKQFLLYTIGIDTAGANALELSDALSLAGNKTPNASNKVSPEPRPELQNEQILAELAICNQKLEASRYKPVVSVFGYLGSQGFNKNVGPSLDPTGMYGNSYIGLQLSVPIFNGYDTDTRITKELLKQQQAENRRQELLRNYNYELSLALQNLNQAWKVLSVRQENVKLAQESARLVGLRQKEGRALPREVLDADAKTAQVIEQELQAYYDLLIARLNFEKASGMVE